MDVATENPMVVAYRITSFGRTRIAVGDVSQDFRKGLVYDDIVLRVSQGLVYSVGFRNALLDGIGSYVHRDAVSSLWFHAWLEAIGGEASLLFFSRLTALFRWLSDFAFQ